MPYAAGVFSLVAGNPVVTNTIVSSTWANTTLSDISTGLSTAILKDGTQPTTASVPFLFGITSTTLLASATVSGNPVISTGTVSGAVVISTATVSGAVISATGTVTGNAVIATGTVSAANVLASTAIFSPIHDTVSGSLTVKASGQSVLTASPSASTTLFGLLDISATAAGQIKFPVTQNPSSDGNTLDDYRENTWTPAIAFGGTSSGVTYTTQLGTYNKIGRQVTVWFNVVLSSKGSGVGTLAITGLPATVANVNNQASGAILWSNMATAVANLQVFGGINTTTLPVAHITAANAGGFTLTTDAVISATTTLFGNTTYYVP